MKLWKFYSNIFQLRNTNHSVRIKNLFLLTYIGGEWYMKKMGEKVPPPRKQELSKKAQEKYYKINRNLHTSNRNLNGWKLKIHLSMLVWVITRSKHLRKNHIQLLQTKILSINMIQRLIGF